MRFLILALLLLVPSLSPAQQVDFAALEKLAAEELEKSKTPGAAVAIIQGDRVIYAKGFGAASVETGALVTPEMLFRLGSTTKMLTAAVLVGLAEEGKLKLDEPVGTYIKGLPPGLARLTAHQLLCHTAGLKDEAPMDGPHDDSALAARVRSWKDDFLIFPAGRIYSYSNPGYVLAGLFIEEVSGKRYADAMAERLFKPLGMERTTLRPLLAMTWPLAQGHGERDGKPYVFRPAADHAGTWPSGSVFSSVQDLSRFVIAFLNGGRLDGKTVLPPAIIHKLSSPHVETHSSDNGRYGYGLTSLEWHGVKLLQHGGARLGYGSVIRMAPEQRVAVIIIANRSGSSLPRTAAKALELLLLPLQPAEPEKAAAELPMTAAEMARYAGRYSHADREMELLIRDGKLYSKQRGTESAVRKVRENWFESVPAAGPPNRFKLITDADGRGEYIHSGGRAMRRRP